MPRIQRPTEISRRLARLGRVFPIAEHLAGDVGLSDVAAYYDACFDSYRRHHSPEGAVHMALNDGSRFDPAGFRGQASRLAAAWQAAPPAQVLELAFGQGYNLAALAPRFPATHFEGIDLTPRHVQHVQALVSERGLANVALREGDFHALPYDSGRFDAVFCVEAMCHALDMPRALAEAARVLRPGGVLTLFDGYLSRPLQTWPEEEALAIRLVARGMAVNSIWIVDDMHRAAAAAGLEPVHDERLDAQIMPSLRRLERITGALVFWPWLGRRALARRHPLRMRNVLAGYLMRCLVAEGVLTYRHLAWRRSGDNPR